MAKTQSLPNWSTPDRREKLVQLFIESGGFCVFGHSKCQIPEHHYPEFTEMLISDWKALDRELASALWKAERKAFHDLGEMPYPTSGRFTAIDREIFAGNQPLYYLEGQAVSGLTFKPFVKVRISSSYIRLYVDLGEALRQVSKSARRKAVRYGKPLPRNTTQAIRRTIFEAVRHYWSS